MSGTRWRWCCAALLSSTILLQVVLALPLQNGLDYGASWEPNLPAYDVNLPVYPTAWSESDKQQQRDAGSKLVSDLAEATDSGQKLLTVSPGVYRLTDSPLLISGTQGFTFSVSGVEIVVEGDIGAIRILNNTDLVIKGSEDDPFVIDSEPIGFTQGFITASSNESQTITLKLMDGYAPPVPSGRIELFAPNGTMLPHLQDEFQNVTDLGNGVYRLGMNPFTFDNIPAPRQSINANNKFNIFQNGNLIAMEQPGRSGLELRNNTNVRMQDMVMAGGLVWALPELGNDVYERFRGVRRPGTNRLVGGGWPLQTFWGGSYTIIDSELANNFDDITDIFSPPSWAFQQQSSRTFYMSDNMDGSAVPIGRRLTMYSFPELAPIGSATITGYADDPDSSATSSFQDVANNNNIRPIGTLRLYTVDSDIQVPELALVNKGLKPRNMTFIHSYFHDGLAGGIQPKGADNIVIHDCIVERTNLLGIGVGFDPFWWEGTPAANINITSNTVVDCAYDPSAGSGQPAISVYAGTDNLNATTPIQTNITISGNLVIGGAGPGIGCERCRNATITDNLIVHASGHAGGYGAIAVDVLSEGTYIANNIFSNMARDAWQLPITTGPIQKASTVKLVNNTAVDPDGKLSNVSWQFLLYNDEQVTYKGSDWVIDSDDNFPGGRAFAYSNQSSATLQFTGSEVAVRAFRDPAQGIMYVYMDGNSDGATRLDLSSLYRDGQDTTVWRSEPLKYGDHNVTVVCGGQDGVFSTTSQFTTLAGFLVLNDTSAAQQCGSDNGACLV